MTSHPSHFDTSAQTWDTDETVRRNLIFAKAIKKYLPQSSSLNILDFGCGTGLLSQHFVQDANNLLGIDTSTGMLEQFALKFKGQNHVKAISVNLEKDDLALANKHFDVIMSAMAFHHLDHPLNMLQKFKSLLSPQGKIFVIDLDKEDGTFHPDNNSMGVKHYGFSKEELKGWCHELNFKSFDHEIIYAIHKNNRDYGVGMAVYS